MIRLKLQENAIHTLHHAVEIMYAVRLENLSDESVDSEPDLNEEDREKETLCPSFGEYLPAPAVYNLKFALLHLIQSSELILKSYVQMRNPQALFQRRNTSKTISLTQALEFTIDQRPALLSQDELALFLSSKALRNQIEHYEFQIPLFSIKQLCTDFLSLCIYLAQELLGLNVIELFQWNELRECENPVGGYLSSLMTGSSELGRLLSKKTGSKWKEQNANNPVFFCIFCGIRSVPRDTGVCMGCGAESDEDLSKVIEGLNVMIKIQELRSKYESRKV